MARKRKRKKPGPPKDNNTMVKTSFMISAQQIEILRKAGEICHLKYQTFMKRAAIDNALAVIAMHRKMYGEVAEEDPRILPSKKITLCPERVTFVDGSKSNPND